MRECVCVCVCACVRVCKQPNRTGPSFVQQEVPEKTVCVCGVCLKSLHSSSDVGNEGAAVVALRGSIIPTTLPRQR